MSEWLRPIDADNHYYEAPDAFTRHLDPKFKRRGVQVVKNGTHTEVVIGERVNGFIPNPTFDPVIVPGCLDLQFRGQIPDGIDPRSLARVEPISAAYRDRDARLETLGQVGTRVMFEQLRDHLPEWRLVPGTQPTIVPSTFARGYDAVHIEF